MEHIDRRKNFSWLNQKVILIFVLYLMITIIGLLGVLYSHLFDSSMRYLFLTPSYLNDTTLNWTTSVWAGVLGIHGTIAALSITFMGMFVSQVSNYSEPGFEDICKSLILRRSKFLFFSLNSIFSLLSGVILLAFGGGVIAYFISIAISLGFILNYGLIYLRLYNITEDPTIIKDYLFLDLKSTGERYYLFNIHRQKLIQKLDLCCEELNHIKAGWSTELYSMEQRALKVFPKESPLILNDFCSSCLGEINNIINKIADDKVSLYMNLNFYQNVSYSSFNIEFKNMGFIKEEVISQIEKILRKALLTSKLNPNEIVIYQKYEQAVIENLRNGLLKGSEWGIDFGVKALFTLTDKNDVVTTIGNLDSSFRYLNKKNSIDYAIFAAFFEKISSECFLRNDFNIASQIMSGVINLGRYLYTADYFYEFYRLISNSLHSRARYNFDDDDFIIFDLYVNTTRENFISQNYMAFELNTNFLTNELRYLKHSDKEDSLSVIEKKMVRCVKAIVTLILIRLVYLLDKGRDDRDEFKSLSQYLKSWCNAAFFEGIYFRDETYDELFMIPDEPDFDASRSLREVPDYEVSSISISNDTYRAIAFLMTQSSLNKNGLNPIFIREKKDFLENTGITTHQLQAIITYLRSDDFCQLLEKVEGDSSDKRSSEAVSEFLESIIVEKNNIVNNLVVESELNDELVMKFKDEVSVSFEKYFNKVLDANSISFSDSVSSYTAYSLIKKREVMKSIDGVHYLMSGGDLAQGSIYKWVKNILIQLKSKNKKIIEINNLSELPIGKIVTIQNKVKNKTGIYRYSKGMRISDENGILGLERPGLYFIDFETEFSFIKGQTLFDVFIEKITTENIELIGGASFFADENPFLYALMSLKINLELIDKDDYSFYYLSVEKCKELSALSKRRVNLSVDEGTFLDQAKNIP